MADTYSLPFAEPGTAGPQGVHCWDGEGDIERDFEKLEKCQFLFIPEWEFACEMKTSFYEKFAIRLGYLRKGVD